MFILDSNIISEFMKPEPDTGVLTYVAVRHGLGIVTTAITVAEIRSGIIRHRNDQRRTALTVSFDTIMDEFVEDVLPFDHAASEAYGILDARLRIEGRSIGELDVMIASIALMRNAPVVTRNISHFESLGIDIVNPFDFG